MGQTWGRESQSVLHLPKEAMPNNVLSCKHTASENIPKQPENICSIKIKRNHAFSLSGGRYNVTLFHL